MTEDNTVQFPDKTVPDQVDGIAAEIRTSQEILALFTSIIDQPANGRAEAKVPVLATLAWTLKMTINKQVAVVSDQLDDYVLPVVQLLQAKGQFDPIAPQEPLAEEVVTPTGDNSSPTETLTPIDETPGQKPEVEVEHGFATIDTAGLLPGS